VGDLVYTDRIMRDGLWTGVYPGLAGAQLEYMACTQILDLVGEYVAAAE
jgi:hypothetical protein